MTDTKQTGFRLPAYTVRQLDQLAQVYGENRTQTLIRVVDRQWMADHADTQDRSTSVQEDITRGHMDR